MIYKNELTVDEYIDKQNIRAEERVVIGEYELILTKGEGFKFLSFKKGKKMKNLLGSVLGITLFEEIKSLREENQKLKEVIEKLRKNEESLVEEILVETEIK